MNTGARDGEWTEAIAAFLPLPVLVVDADGQILFVNPATEQFFGSGAGMLVRRRLGDIVSSGAPLLGVIAEARLRGASVAERDVGVSTLRGGERLTDIAATPLPGADGAILVTLQERDLAQRLDRQFVQRSAVRSLTGMAAILAHEIKNPLSGIRGAAQLIEESLSENDRELTQLICAETDRIGALIDRMENFGDRPSLQRRAVNIHEVLDHVCRLAQSGFARHVAFRKTFDPSLPSVPGDRDQLVQLFVNLVRNASDAVAETGGEIELATAYRRGMRLRASAAQPALGLPLEVTVRDNGSGIAADLLAHIFDPFVTTKSHGAGLGLALAAKIVDDHGGMIACESAPGRTQLRVLLPAAPNEAAT